MDAAALVGVTVTKTVLSWRYHTGTDAVFDPIEKAMFGTLTTIVVLVQEEAFAVTLPNFTTPEVPKLAPLIFTLVPTVPCVGDSERMRAIDTGGVVVVEVGGSVVVVEVGGSVVVEVGGSVVVVEVGGTVVVVEVGGSVVVVEVGGSVVVVVGGSVVVVGGGRRGRRLSRRGRRLSRRGRRLGGAPWSSSWSAAAWSSWWSLRRR